MDLGKGPHHILGPGAAGFLQYVPHSADQLLVIWVSSDLIGPVYDSEYVLSPVIWIYTLVLGVLQLHPDR